eukprot:SAG31_NODE_633_length_13382_cov_11.528911_6_plen_208_part_00
MVDTSATAPVLPKSTAHKDLAESLRQRDGGAYFHLCMGEHLTELQHRYEDAMSSGYTRQELRRKENVDKLISDTAQQMTMNGWDYDDDYLRLAYDEQIEKGILISATELNRRLSSEFDAAQNDSSARSTPLSPWVVPDDHDLKDAAGLQSDRDVDESMWRAQTAATNTQPTVDYRAAIDAAAQKLSETDDAQEILALQAKINVLEMQ